jgi:signal transduction histidine kinase
VSLGVIVALLAARSGGRLERRIREQHGEAIRHREELERLSSKLLMAQEEERRRIARELHDEVGQALSALKLELAVAQRATDAPHTALAEARAIVDRTLQSVRDLSQLLHPSMLDDLGLPDTADWYLRAFARRTGIPTKLVVDRLDQRLTPAVEVCTYRVIQEAMTNIARHAEARSCRVHISRDVDALRVVVEDDGKGFIAGAADGAEARGLGLVGVRERVTGLGGTLRVESGAGLGTRLTVVMPLSA